METDKSTSKNFKIMYETFFNMLRINKNFNFKNLQNYIWSFNAKGYALISVMIRYESLNSIIILSVAQLQALRTGCLLYEFGDLSTPYV
jgi:hypothetical protein